MSYNQGAAVPVGSEDNNKSEPRTKRVRPKQAVQPEPQDIAAILSDILSQHVLVGEGKQLRFITKLQAVFEARVNNALRDGRDSEKILALREKYKSPGSQADAARKREGERVVADFFNQLAKTRERLSNSKALFAPDE